MDTETNAYSCSDCLFQSKHETCDSKIMLFCQEMSLRYLAGQIEM